MPGYGWISIHRKIKECWIWDEKPFDKTHAWLDILLSANHQDRKIKLGNELLDVKRGSFITSELKLMDKWGWSKTKLRSFLKLLKEDNMVEIVADKKKTTINVVNYSVYQEIENHEETIEKPQENHIKTMQEPCKDTNNNTNNGNKLNNDNKLIIILSPFENEFIEVLKTIENYPLDLQKEREMIATLKERYPNLDLIQAIKDWAIYKKDNPLKTKCSPRSQINTSFKKYVEWGKCKKEVKHGTSSRNIEQELREQGIGL